jgi:hypothetical protein
MGIPSRIGKAKPACTDTSSFATLSYRNGPLVSGQTSISSSFESTICILIALFLSNA